MRKLIVILSIFFCAKAQAQITTANYWVLEGDTIYGSWLPYVTVHGGQATSGKAKRK